MFCSTPCEHLLLQVWSCWNRKLSHRFLVLFDCFTCTFCFVWEFYLNSRRLVQYKWILGNLEGVNRRAYEKNFSRCCGFQWESCVTVFPAYWYSCLSPHVSDRGHRAGVLGSANGEGEFCASYLSQDRGSLAVYGTKTHSGRWCAGKTELINLFNWYAGVALVVCTWMMICSVIWKV